MSGIRIPESFYGHDAVAEEVVTYNCYECGRKLTRQPDGTFTHVPRDSAWRDRDRDSSRWYKQQQKAAAEARLAAAVPYEGAISRCQASVMPGGRGGLSHRCNYERPRALYVVSREPYWGGKIATTGKTVDRIVVCSTHARDNTSHRHHEHRWGGIDKPQHGDALELVEEEYR